MKKSIQLLCILLLTTLGLNAAPVQWSKRLEGGSSSAPLRTNYEMCVVDGDFSSLSSNAFKDYSQEAYIKLGLNEKALMNYYASNQLLTVVVTVTPYSNSGVALTPFDQTLSIEYATTNAVSTTIDADDYRMRGGVYMFKVKVKTITLNGSSVTDLGTGNYVYLEAGIIADRYYTFNSNAQSAVVANTITYSATGSETVTYNTTSTASNTDEIEMAWSNVKGAEYYDLEWVWVDNYPATGTTPLATSAITLSEADFARNSTRIRTSHQFYRIPQMFEKGYIVYRVRAVGRWADDLQKDLPGVWSGSTATKTYVSNWTNVIQVTTEHENLMNWQYQATYAEDGRRKDVAQYFDGSLRGKQTVTRLTSKNQSVVGETIYDNEGRGVIQILPVPQDNPAIKFYDNVNTTDGTNPYTHLDFDWESNVATCGVVNQAGPMNTTKGASKYYSTAGHTTDLDWQQYTPDAQGYPYTQIEYEPNNSGRIRSQSGVGASHQIGTGHETKYYYLQPSQEELNRLFGYKVGYKTRYKKNMVVDANGQVSVSYLDAQGRVVATALTGNDVTPFDALSSELDNAKHLTMTTDLLNKANPTDVDMPNDDNQLYSTGRFGNTSDALKISTQIGVVDNNTVYNFTYNADFGSYQESCGAGSGVNFPFVYDLTLSLKNDCGVEQFTTTYFNLDASAFPGYVATFSQAYSKQLSQGSYTLYKEIKVNEQALLNYKTQYLSAQSNPCLLTSSAFTYAEADDCIDNTCESCLTNLGTLAEYAASLSGQNLSNPTITQMYNSELAECNALCALPTSCESYYGMMISDMRPHGQYGGLEAGDPLSIYNVSSTSLSGTWKTPTSFVDEYGNSVLITAYLYGNGDKLLVNDGTATEVQIVPNQLTNVADFVSVFEDSWAEAFVTFHPEHKIYLLAEQFCTQKSDVGTVYTAANGKALSSDQYDALLNKILTHADASVTTTNGISFTSNADAINKILTSDPFWNQTYSLLTSVGPLATNMNTAVKNALLSEMFDITGSNKGFKGKMMDIFKFSVKSAIYGNDFSGAAIAETGWSSVSGYTVAQKDAIWTTFRSNYISYKNTIRQVLLDVYGFTQSYTPVGGSTKRIFNGAIGSDQVSLNVETSLSAINTTTYATVWNTIFSIWNQGVFMQNLPVAFEGNIYDSKTIRLTRIDNLYGAGDETAIVNETSAQADYATWAETGLCPLTLDVERLLHGLGTRGQLKQSLTMAQIPELTTDLFTAIRGTAPIIGSTMSISGAVSGTNLVLTFSGTPAYSITLPQIDPSIPWSTYAVYPSGTPWNIYEISSSFPVSGTSVSVLVKAGTSLATAQEYVITYTSNSVNLNGCQTAFAAAGNTADCDKEQLFEGAVLDMLQKLRAAGNLYSGTNVSLTTLSGFTYPQIFIDHFGSTATWTGGSTARITGTNGKFFSLGFTIPNTSPLVMFTGINVVGSTLYGQYINPSNNQTTQVSGFYEFNDGRIKTNLYISCNCDDGVNVAIKNLLNKSIAGITYGTQPDELEDLTSYLTLENPVVNSIIHNANTHKINLVQIYNPNDPMANDCNITLSSMSISIGLQTVTDVVMTDATTFNATVLLSNATTVVIPGTISCKKACSTCTADPQPPVSCNSAYTSYLSAMQTKFSYGTMTTEEQTAFMADYVPSLSDFCDRNYSYISTAYTTYINNAQISNLMDQDFVSIGDFGATSIGYSNTKLTTAATAYFTYLGTNPTPRLNWSQYIETVYLVANSVCPAYTPPVYIPNTVIPYQPCMTDQNINIVNSQTQQAIYLQQTGDAFVKAYIEKAMSTVVEKLKEDHRSKEYHYTLYYYDRAGNLIQTVPPKGVSRFEYDANNNPVNVNTPSHQTINAMRTANATQNISNLVVADNPTAPAPVHTLKTNYKYNSLNQLVYQVTPDGGESKFAYDKLGRLVLSQNAKQVASNSFSYTSYDALGRVVEVGQFSTASATYTINSIGRLVLISNGTEVNVDNVITPTTFTMWINTATFSSATRIEVTRTVYDEFSGMTAQISTGTVGQNTLVPVATLFGAEYKGNNTRNRIVAVLYQSTYNASISTYDNTSLYDYDVHGNVKQLIQINNDASLAAINHHVKRFYYEYELVSGNVKQVYYQKDDADQLIHRYKYDSDNRITMVETSKDGIHYENDAKYFYYNHGPLARTEIGNTKVQALDYAYTIQGWLKSVNGEKIDQTTMMGKDGITTGTAQVNKQVARDAYGYSLSYYDNDYKSANNQMLNFEAALGATPSTQLGPNLYNGNIRAMHSAISDNAEASAGGYTHQTRYGYDQLNRIKRMDGYKAITPGVAPAASGYGSTYTYDDNGNILSMTNAAFNGTVSVPMDNFSYNYLTGTNKLTSVSDAVATTTWTGEDIENQSANNYSYDQIGQLIGDAIENITNIKWTVTNKVKEVIYGGPLAGKKIVFEYDAMGHRIEKKVTATNGDIASTFYVLDAQGNTISTYSHTTAVGSLQNKLYLSDQNLYGSSRIGVEEIDKEMTMDLLYNYFPLGSVQTIGSTQLCTSTGKWYIPTVGSSVSNLDQNTDGVTDVKFTNNSLFSYSSQTGMNVIPGNTYTVDFDYLSKTNLSNLTYDVRDCSSGTLFMTAISTNALGHKTFTFTVPTNASNKAVLRFNATQTATGLKDFVIGKLLVQGKGIVFDIFKGPEKINYANKVGDKRFELSNHLGNVLNVITDRKLPITDGQPTPKIAYYTADVSSYSDYYAFGTLMTGRHGSSNEYDRGFNGQLKDDELKGEGNSYDFGNRMYDPRIGKFLSTDRLAGKYAYQSPYVFAGNTPIMAIDAQGDSIRYVKQVWNSELEKMVPEIKVVTQAMLDDLGIFEKDLIPIREGIKTDLGAETYGKYMNSPTLDVYVGFSNGLTQGLGEDIFGKTLTPSGVEKAIGTTNIFQRPNSDFSLFNDVEVVAGNENHFVVLDNSTTLKDNQKAEAAFHEFTHVDYFNSKIPSEEHHAKMGQTSSGIAEPEKIIGKFMTQLRDVQTKEVEEMIKKQETQEEK